MDLLVCTSRSTLAGLAEEIVRRQPPDRVVGIGPRLRGDLDTQLRIRLDQWRAHFSARASGIAFEVSNYRS
jgi:hypothetical protein